MGRSLSQLNERAAITVTFALVRLCLRGIFSAIAVMRRVYSLTSFPVDQDQCTSFRSQPYQYVKDHQTSLINCSYPAKCSKRVSESIVSTRCLSQQNISRNSKPHQLHFNISSFGTTFISSTSRCALWVPPGPLAAGCPRRAVHARAIVPAWTLCGWGVGCVVRRTTIAARWVSLP